jgi:hypothetical protein
MKHDYTRLDAEIIEQISKGKSNFTGIYIAVSMTVARIIESTGKKSDDWRVVDRRLQALRKAGRISYLGRGGWVIGKDEKERA